MMTHPTDTPLDPTRVGVRPDLDIPSPPALSPLGRAIVDAPPGRPPLLLEAALTLAGKGWRVHPCIPTGPKAKAPLLPHGLTDASTDPLLIIGWWTKWPAALIGAVVPDGLVVLDVDPRHGGTLKDLEQYGAVPATLTCVSGRGDGGLHLYYRAPAAAYIGTRLPAGIDLRCAGKSYLIVPPSLHPASGLPYRWLRYPVTDAPQWLLGLLRPAQAVTRNAPALPATDKRLSGWLTVIVNAPAGTRNAKLFWAACRAAETGVLDEARVHLQAAAENVGLTATEIERTLASAANRAVA